MFCGRLQFWVQKYCIREALGCALCSGHEMREGRIGGYDCGVVDVFDGRYRVGV